MEILFEFLLELILTPIVEIIVGVPTEQFGDVLKNPEISKSRKALLFIVLVLVLMLVLGLLMGAVFGAVMLATGKNADEKNIGLALLVIGIAGLIVYIVVAVVMMNKKRRRHKRHPKVNGRPDRAALRRIVHVVIDRPLGSTHPEHDDIVYELNYGFVPEVMGGDGEAQDAYVIGVDEPITELDGVVIAIIDRKDDVEDKWVVAPMGVEVSDEEIIAKTAFQEKFFQTEIIR